jgi:hypothetical protein
MNSYYNGSGLGLGRLGAASDKVPTHPMGSLGSVGMLTPTSWNPTPLQSALYLAALASMGVLGYHGYKRNDSVGWAVVWGLFGSMVWPITVPVAFAQGYAKPARMKRNRRRSPSRPRRRTSRRPARRTSRRR